MIISILIDVLYTNLRQLGWAYYLFMDRCRTSNWRCVVEQKYVSWQLGEQDRADLTGAQGAWDYSFSLDSTSVQEKVAVIPQGIFEQCQNQYGALAVYHLLTQSWGPLEEYLNNLFDLYEKQESIEGIVIYPLAPYSIRRIAEERNIPLFVLEVCPMRWPIYTGGAYFTHFNQMSSDPGECEKMYRRFQEEWEQKQFPLLTQEEILAIYLEAPYLPYLRYLYIQPDSEALLIGTGTNGKMDIPMNWDQTKMLAAQVRKRFGEDVRFRPDMRDPFEARFGMRDEQYSQENPNIISILRSKRCVCAGSNMMFEAMLWGRPVYCDTKGHGLYFISNHTDNWKDEKAPIDFLNFYAFVYAAPMDIATTDDYVRWRLTEPSLEELYRKHVNHYLGRWGMNIEQIENKPAAEIVDMIAKAKGVQGSCYPSADLSDDEKTWESLQQKLCYSIGPVAERLQIQRQKELDYSSDREQLNDVQRELNETKNINQELVSVKASLLEKNDCLIGENSELSNELKKTKEELSKIIQTLDDQNKILMIQLQESNDRNAELETRLDGFFHSRSWRVTAPLRWIVNVCRKICKRIFGD